jgi:putative membrane-bound dehydrogenase-like protein
MSGPVAGLVPALAARAAPFAEKDHRMRPLYPFAVLLFAAPLPIFAAEDRPLPPSEAPHRMTLPPGFQATLFAGEPDVVQPIAFTFDDRGRLWVVECYSYPHWLTKGTGRDRVLIFEDTDGDGRFDKRTVFWDKGTNLSGIAVGFGGVWLCATPNLLFIPDRDGDGVPDGPPEVVLDGWSLEAKHNVFNSLTWGPDGWLYGCNGILATSHVGRPGSPAAERVPFNCGVWRWHPTKHRFEVVANGTTNPWGLDFDDRGRMFITNCVIHHLWHVIPGAHYQRMYGQDFNPHLYRLMESCADHIHWGGGPWTESRGGKGVHDQPGGGHAHVGAMVYLGDNWPERYRGGLFTCNLHGSRVNHDVFEPRGSGVVAHHAPDFLLANDPWFRGLTIQCGPDGGVFVSDWCDTGECHNYDKVHISGRIYKVTYGKPTPWQGDVARLGDAELVRLQLHPNDWHARHARRVLQERAAAGRLAPETRPALVRLLRDGTNVPSRLRALWALHGTGGLEEPLLTGLLDDPEAALRGWAVQLALEDRNPAAAVLAKLTVLAAKDPSPVVRLALASGLQRLPTAQRWPIAEALVTRGEDAADANLPLMVWYGIEALLLSDRDRYAGLIARARIPLLREHVARRVAALTPEPTPSDLRLLVRVLDQVDEPAVQLDVLRGLREAFTGRRQVAMPEGWPTAYRRLAQSPNAEVRETATHVAVVFGDPQALAALKKTMTDPTADPSARRGALETLVHKHSADLVPVLHGLLDDRVLCGPALRGLAAYRDDATPPTILRHYSSFNADEKADAVHTLASRPAYALALLDAVAHGQVPRGDVSAFNARQMLALNDQGVTARLNAVWGAIRPAAKEKAKLLTKYKALLTPEAVKNADRSHGRSLYAHTCASCHVLFGEGGKVGPELTGSQRANLDYVLENLLDPSAVVARDYQVTVLTTKDGRVLTGIIKQETEAVVALQTQNEVVHVPKGEIDERVRSPQSMMPEGLLDKLTNKDVRDLVAYLASPVQVPLPQEAAGNQQGAGWITLFGDKDLGAWDKPAKEWIIAGDAALDAMNPRRLVPKPGTGVLVNGPKGRAANLVSKEKFTDVEAHVEFLIPKGSNSGVKLMGLYEIQIFDSYGKKELTGSDCGGVYPRGEQEPKYHTIDKGVPPRVNAARPAGEWQTLDITFRAPRFDADGKKTADARFIKVVHNGQVIHEDVPVHYPTGSAWRLEKEIPRGPLLLQADHGPVAFRNVRVRPIQ